MRDRIITALLFVFNVITTAVNIENQNYGWAVLTGFFALFMLALIASGEV